MSADDGDTGRDPDDSNQDLYVDEHPQVWSYLSEALKYASRASSFTRPEKPLSKLDIAVSNSLYCGELFNSFHTAGKKKKKAAARKEASTVEMRSYAKQFQEAKRKECQSWKECEVYKLVDMRKHKPRNFVTGRWVLTIKRNPDGSFDKCKARWVLRGFQDKQKWDQQADSPTATGPSFRLSCQKAVNEKWNLLHIDF